MSHRLLWAAQPVAELEVVFVGTNLIVEAASPRYLLAMKLTAVLADGSAAAHHDQVKVLGSWGWGRGVLVGVQVLTCSLMSMVWIQLGTCSIWWLSVRAAMTFRAPGGLVGGHGVQPSVMTTMASGLVSAAAAMPVPMLVPPAPSSRIWLLLCICWSVWTSVSTDRTLTLVAGYNGGDDGVDLGECPVEFVFSH